METLFYKMYVNQTKTGTNVSKKELFVVFGFLMYFWNQL